MTDNNRAREEWISFFWQQYGEELFDDPLLEME